MKKSLLALAVAAFVAGANYMYADNSQGDHSGGFEEFHPINTHSAAFFIPDEPSQDEQEALKVFLECYPFAPTLNSEKFDLEKIAAYTTPVNTIWIHINREGCKRGYENLPAPFGEDEFIDKLKTFCLGGGKLYLSGLATQLVYAIGRQPSNYQVNQFWSNDANVVSMGYTKELAENDPWYILGGTWDAGHNGTFGNAMHAMYGQTYDNFPGWFAALKGGRWEEHANDQIGDVMTCWPFLQANEGETKLMVSDNNCMWNYNKQDFRIANNAEILGTWGHDQNLRGTDQTVYGIVEFRPDVLEGETEQQISDKVLTGHATFPVDGEAWKGTIIANGLAAYQFGQGDDNRWRDNLRNLTFNTINYLTGEFDAVDEEGKPVGPTLDIEAVDFTPAETGKPVYYNLQGARIGGPIPGTTCIRVTGTKAVKVICR